jgi:hypothetical protein
MMAAPKVGIEALIKELRQVVNAGIGSIDDSLATPGMAGFLWVGDRARSDDAMLVAKAVEALVKLAIDSLNGTTVKEHAKLLFAYHSETLGLPAKARRDRTADSRGVNRVDFERNDQVRILRVVARRIYDIEFEYLQDLERLGPPPSIEDIKATWSERFVHYHAMQHELRAMRHELIEAVTAGNQMPDEQSLRDAEATSIWYFTRYLIARDRFIEKLANDWFLPDAAADSAARRSTDLVRWKTPFNERGRSFLRTVLYEVTGAELYPFAYQLEDSPQGAEIVGMWQEWISECDGEIERDDPSCDVHGVIAAADAYVTLIDDQWPKIRERYR